MKTLEKVSEVIDDIVYLRLADWEKKYGKLTHMEAMIEIFKTILRSKMPEKKDYAGGWDEGFNNAIDRMNKAIEGL